MLTFFYERIYIMRKIIRKLLIFLWITIFTYSSTNIILANSEIYNFKEVRCNAYLINVKTGMKYKIKTKKLPTFRSMDDEIEAGFVIEPKKENLIPVYSFRSLCSQENEEVDDSSSVRGIVKIKYSKRYNSNNEEEYLLKSVSGKWKVLEPRGIKLSNRRLAYTCWDAMDISQVRLKNKFK